MKMTQEEFNNRFKATIDALLDGMAENQEIDVKKFYNMVYFLENLTFFGPVFYGMMKEGKAPEP